MGTNNMNTLEEKVLRKKRQVKKWEKGRKGEKEDEI